MAAVRGKTRGNLACVMTPVWAGSMMTGIGRFREASSVQWWPSRVSRGVPTARSSALWV